MSTIKQTSPHKGSVGLGKQRSYNEIIEFFEKNWAPTHDEKSLERMKKFSKLFGKPSNQLPTILIAGTNGKSLTAHFLTKLLLKEGLSVGSFLSPHILTYNERISSDAEAISNKLFTELANEVISTAETANLKVTTREYLTQMALNHFKAQKVDVVILEAEKATAVDATAIWAPKIIAVTRLAGHETDETGKASDQTLKKYIGTLSQETHLVSADQNKLNLKRMGKWAEELGAHWEMPIRKLVSLSYPFEQLHGRCAALAERIASIFVNNFIDKSTLLVNESILTHQKGQRGRPTLEAKRQLELNPKQTIEHFWKETFSTLPGRFQILDKEKPSILLDTADNLDAVENLFLGIRLLHYQRPLKGLALIMACDEEAINPDIFAKLIRYFFKKTAGHIIICPLTQKNGWQKPSWNVEKMNNAFKAVKVKSRITSSFKEAFEAAKKLVSDRHGLIVVAGSSTILQEYWNYKGIKKL